MLKRLTAEQALELVQEDLLSDCGGYSYHSLLSLLIDLDSIGKHVCIPVKRLISACNNHCIAVRFDEEDQSYVLGVEHGPAEAHDECCSFGWTVEEPDA